MMADPERFTFSTKDGQRLEAATAQDLRAAVDAQGLPIANGLVGYHSDGPGVHALGQVLAAFPHETGLRWFSHRRYADDGLVV